VSRNVENVVLRLDQCREEELTWLWPRRLAAGKLALIDGDPQQGKSLLTLDLAARVSAGKPFPDGHPAAGAATVLLIGGEDGLRDTVVPRLRAAGADLARVRLWEGQRRRGLCRPPLFPRDCGRLRRTVEEHGARLVVIDPFLAYLSARACSVSDQMVRQALTPLTQIAEATGAAVVLVRHLTKGGQGRSALYRGTGAIAIIGAARTAFLVAADPDDRRRRVLACTKTNLTEPPPSLAFSVRADGDGRPHLEWAGEVARTADDLLHFPRTRRRGDGKPAAADFLERWLRDGPQSRDRLYCKARAHDISERTLHRAKAWLEVASEVRRHGGRNVWYWRLKDDDRPFDPADDYARFMEEFWEPDEVEGPTNPERTDG
jgi:hypothetical protein